MLLLQARVDLGTMAIKGYSAFLKAPALLEPHHQISYCHIQDTCGSFTLLQRCSWYILQPQSIGPRVDRGVKVTKKWLHTPHSKINLKCLTHQRIASSFRIKCVRLNFTSNVDITKYWLNLKFLTQRKFFTKFNKISNELKVLPNKLEIITNELIDISDLNS